MSCFICCLRKNCDKVKISENNLEPVVSSELDVQDHRLIREIGELIFNDKDMDDKGVRFLIDFFIEYPHHQKYFKAFRHVEPKELKNLPEVANHGRRVMDQLNILITHLEEPPAMKAQMEDLAKRHRPRHVRPKQMKDMLSMFVVFARAEIGPAFTTRHEIAWKKMVNNMVSMLEESSGINGSRLSDDQTSVTFTDMDGKMSDTFGSDENKNAHDDLHGDGLKVDSNNVDDNTNDEDVDNTNDEEADNTNDEDVDNTNNDEDNISNTDDDDVDIIKEGSGDNASISDVVVRDPKGDAEPV